MEWLRGCAITLFFLHAIAYKLQNYALVPRRQWHSVELTESGVIVGRRFLFASHADVVVCVCSGVCATLHMNHNHFVNAEPHGYAKQTFAFLLYPYINCISPIGSTAIQLATSTDRVRAREQSYLGQQRRRRRRRRRFHIDSQVHCVRAHPLYRPLSRRGLLDPVKLAYDPCCRKAGS